MKSGCSFSCWYFCFLLQFYEELIYGKDTDVKEQTELPNKPLNKKIKFVYSDDDDDDEEDEEEDDDDEEEEVEGEKDEVEDREEENKPDANQNNDVKSEIPTNEKLDFPDVENSCCGNETEEKTNDNEESAKDLENQTNEAKEPPAKKQCIETCASKSVVQEKGEQKSIDKLIEDELKEIGDRNKASNIMLLFLYIFMFFCLDVHLVCIHL